MQVGDKVLYVPHKDHALNVNRDGTMAWAIHRQPYRHESGLQVMTPDEIKKAVAIAKRRKQPFVHHEANKPRCTWPAVVQAIEGDNVTLAIQGPVCELIYTVPMSEAKAPHTCHKEESSVD